MLAGPRRVEKIEVSPVGLMKVEQTHNKSQKMTSREERLTGYW